MAAFPAWRHGRKLAALFGVLLPALHYKTNDFAAHIPHQQNSKQKMSAAGSKGSRFNRAFVTLVHAEHPGQVVTANANSAANSLLKGLAERIAATASDITVASGRRTVDAAAVLSAARSELGFRSGLATAL